VRYFIAAFGIVFFWRGVWVLSDIYLFPSTPFDENHLKSGLVSVILGIVLLYIDDFSLDELKMIHPHHIRKTRSRK
jgi:hypothetical protein